MIKILVLTILAMTTGCGSIDMYRSVAADKGADAADQALETSVWGQCQAATLGAFSRRYPTVDERTTELARCDKEAVR